MRISGKAADLLADVVVVTREDYLENYRRRQDVDSNSGMLSKEETSDKPVTKQDKNQTDLFELLGLLDSGVTKGYDFFAAMQTLDAWANDEKTRTIVEDDTRRIVDLKLRRMLLDVYQITVDLTFSQHKLYGCLRDCLEAVATGMVSVFDLEKNADDFNGAVLDCILRGLVHKEPVEQAWLRIR